MVLVFARFLERRLWFRNDWATWIAASNRAAEKPGLIQVEAAAGP